jgi:SNW domain-containing protein 1
VTSNVQLRVCARFSRIQAEEVQERDQIRQDRHRDRERERRMNSAAPSKRNALSKDKERDVRAALLLLAHNLYAQRDFVV